MDISYLLFLQHLREVTGGYLDSLAVTLSTYGEVLPALLVLSVLYWCIDKRLGQYLLMGWGYNRLANGFAKITVCAYRPWIRDARVQPLPSVISAATGYSFPSGHTCNATSIYGGLALRRELSKPLRIGLVLIVVLIGFSRNWVGVPTPQDVLVSLVVGVVLMLAAQRTMQMIDEHPERDVIVTCLAAAGGIALMLYATYKTYPMDYDAAGNLVVDPMKMAVDSFKNAGWTAGIFVGWLAERRLVNFSSEGTLEQRLCRGVWGVLGLLVVYNPVTNVVRAIIPSGAGASVACFLQAVYIVYAVPALITYFETKKAKQEAEALPEAA